MLFEASFNDLVRGELVGNEAGRKCKVGMIFQDQLFRFTVCLEGAS
jgi:hypothetical protein